MRAHKPSLAVLRKAARRAFDRGTWITRKPYMNGTGEVVSVYASRLHGECSTHLTVSHRWSAEVARERLLAILTVFGDRREATLNSGNVYSWSKP